MATPNGDKWTSVVADWITSGFINSAVCAFAANSYPETPLGKTLLYLGIVEFVRSVGYSLQSLFAQGLDDRIVNSVSSFTYGSMWGLTDILCIHYSLMKLSIVDPHLCRISVRTAFRVTYAFIFATHWGIGIFALVCYLTGQNKSDNNFKLVKFVAIGLLESWLIFRILCLAYTHLWLIRTLTCSSASIHTSVNFWL